MGKFEQIYLDFHILVQQYERKLAGCQQTEQNLIIIDSDLLSVHKSFRFGCRNL